MKWQNGIFLTGYFGLWVICLVLIYLVPDSNISLHRSQRSPASARLEFPIENWYAGLLAPQFYGSVSHWPQFFLQQKKSWQAWRPKIDNTDDQDPTHFLALASQSMGHPYQVVDLPYDQTAPDLGILMGINQASIYPKMSPAQIDKIPFPPYVEKFQYTGHYWSFYPQEKIEKRTLIVRAEKLNKIIDEYKKGPLQIKFYSFKKHKKAKHNFLSFIHRLNHRPLSHDVFEIHFGRFPHWQIEEQDFNSGQFFLTGKMMIKGLPYPFKAIIKELHFNPEDQLYLPSSQMEIALLSWGLKDAEINMAQEAIKKELLRKEHHAIWDALNLGQLHPLWQRKRALAHE